MKKKIFFAALCVCLVAAIACGSLAYFTASHSKTNRFMTAAYDPTNPDPDPDDVFSVEVIEDAKKEENNPKSVGGEKNDKGGYDYKELVPGSEAAKKVTVKNTGKYGEYVRMQVTVTKAKEWQTFFKKINGGSEVNLVEKLCGGLNKTAWELVKTTPNNAKDTITYIYNYSKNGVGTVLAEGDTTPALFTKVIIPDEDFDSEDFTAVDGFEVKVIAEAIQSDYTGTISEAFDLYEAQ